MPDFLDTPDGRRIAYHLTDGLGPTVVFCGGFKSDMDGTKALHLEAWAKENRRAFLRFDYFGHGMSSGDMMDGTISRWTKDATAIITQFTAGPQILIGSSLGGWIMLNLIKQKTVSAAGCIGIAAAPDFTEDLIWNSLSEEQQKEILEKLQALNPQAKVVKSLQSKIDVMDILNTNLYKDKDDFYVTSTKHEANQDQETEANKNTGKRVPEACTARFDIKSFVYRARYNFKSLQDQGKNQVVNYDQDQLKTF